MLGPIRFDDGQPSPTIYGSVESDPQWVARPNGWDDADFEVLLDCELDAPSDASIEHAIHILRDLDRIVQQAKTLSGQDVTIAWFDCAKTLCTAALTDARDPYILGLLK